MLTANDVILNADASVNQTSIPFPLTNDFGVALTAKFTGSPAGTIKLQGSVNPGMIYPETPPLVVDWNDIIGSSQTASGSGLVTWNYNGAMFKWIQCVWTASSGTGNITVTANSKGM